MSNIEWTDCTWSPVVGCTPVSPGCLTDPLHWRKPRRVFVNSMSDLFHEAVPFEFIDRVFAVMALCPQHTFQVLTKRPERMAEYTASPGRLTMVSQAGAMMGHGEATMRFCWPVPNVWLGTSIESDAQHARAWELLKCPAAVRFLSLEPLIGPVDLDRWELLCKAWSDKRPTMGRYIDWVIVGGESGPHARPCNVEWIRAIVRQCEGAGVPCFVKQLGGVPQVVAGEEDVDYLASARYAEKTVTLGKMATLKLRHRKGGDMAEWPQDLRVREWPAVKP